MKALIFDCDGVLVDTERDGHRVAFNRAFEHEGVNAYWDVEIYGDLVKISGGKERMRHYFDEVGWPENVKNRDEFIAKLHKTKTDIFTSIIEKGELPLRPGVRRIVDEAIRAGLKLAICSTSNERSVNMIAERMLGQERKEKFNAILAGDVVRTKKPDPEIYLLALNRLSVKPEECVVIEDSRNGLLSAKSAGMYCVVTKSSYTEKEDFSEADLVVADLENHGNPVTAEQLKRIAEQRTAGE